MKNALFNNWSVMRWIRLALAVFFIVVYFTMKEGDVVALIAAAFFGSQAIFNYNCCCSGDSCSLPRKK